MDRGHSHRHVLVLLTGLIAAGVLLATSSAALGGTWKFVAAGRDCGGTDVDPCTAESFIPSPGRCGGDSPARSAVCWDGTTFGNVSGCNFDATAPWCTYKTRSAAACVGGDNPGFLYECIDDPLAVPVLSAAGTAAMVIAFAALAVARTRTRSAKSS